MTPLTSSLTLPSAALSSPAHLTEPRPLRCRLGLHRWLPLALSLPGAGTSRGVRLCRCCPAVQRV